jgi:hypothetical protein
MAPRRAFMADNTAARILGAGARAERDGGR